AQSPEIVAEVRTFGALDSQAIVLSDGRIAFIDPYRHLFFARRGFTVTLVAPDAAGLRVTGRSDFSGAWPPFLVHLGRMRVAGTMDGLVVLSVDTAGTARVVRRLLDGTQVYAVATDGTTLAARESTGDIVLFNGAATATVSRIRRAAGTLFSRLAMTADHLLLA